MKRRHHCKTSHAKLTLAVLALCSMTAFWAVLPGPLMLGRLRIPSRTASIISVSTLRMVTATKITIMTVR